MIQEAEESWKSESYSTENSSLLLLLRGVCLRYMGEMPLTTLVTLVTIFQVLLLGQRTVSVKFLLMRPSSKWTGEHRIDI